ncbi:MAG: kynureninase [Cyclobacteriaceae bacterium]|nr:kynureninase [Cyclobacteriaceae bacterium]
MTYESNIDYARKLDELDPLKEYRNKFYIPQHQGKDSIYFTGNSLGLQPKSTSTYLQEELESWKQHGVEGHFEGKRPWFHYHKFSKEVLAKIMGAKPIEVVAMNNLTSNLHFMMVSFYRPNAQRYKIITEKGAFPSDQYALESQIKFHGFNPEEALVELKPRKGEHTLRTEDIIAKISEVGDELSLVMMGGVQYYTGQYFDIKSITKAGQNVGAMVGFDLAHAAGNVPVNLHSNEVDFAVWCSYKYLNSGPGGVSGIFIHEKHANNTDLPRFAGWWGHDEEQRFFMKKGFIPMKGADGWQLSNVNVLTSAAHLASLEIIDKIGIDSLRKKSIILTGYLEYLLNKLNLDRKVLEIITPSNPEERGCQLSLLVNKNGKQIFDKLTQQGVVADWREPNVIRIAPVPLYNTFEDVYRFVDILKST